jgi:PIN domain nuclease of toxin-antitoxin system
VRVLLDTHALLWWMIDSPELSDKAREAIRSRNNEVLVSAASIWEIAIKYRLGRLPEADRFVHSVEPILEALDFKGLPITLNHAKRAGLLPLGEHKDPFDKMLIAQSIAEDIPLVSDDELFDSYHVQRIW